MGELERAVMDVLWACDDGTSCTVREVFTALSASRDIAYTTVMTVLDRLAKKGLAVQHREGRAFHYAPSEPRAAMVAGLMLDALDDTSSDVRRAALVRFAERVTADEAAALQAVLAQVVTPEPADRPSRVKRRRPSRP